MQRDVTMACILVHGSYHARMRNVLALIPVLLVVGACASKGSSDDTVAAAEAAAATSSAPTASAAPPQWQLLRQQYTECAKAKAEAGAAGSASTQKVVAEALQGCKSELDTMRTAFRTYLDDKNGSRMARQASDRVSRDTEDKVRGWLLRHVEYQRAVAGR